MASRLSLQLVAAHVSASHSSSSPSSSPPSSLQTSTLAVHADRIAEQAEAGAALEPQHRSTFSTAVDVAPPISVSTTYEQNEGGHVYSRSSAPTRERCEAVLAAIEGPAGGVQALLYSSGLSAVHAALVALLAAGVKRIAISGGYHVSRRVSSTASASAWRTWMSCSCFQVMFCQI